MARCPGSVSRNRLVEDLGHQPHAPVLADVLAVAGDDAAGLLAPVLQGIEAEVGQPGRLGMAVDAEDAAVFFGLVVGLARLFAVCRSVRRFHIKPCPTA